ncbi:MAG: DUF4440 domain-containing protein [Capnocytophaga sp.]|nr:DUF4440 domain-containing protein [Capnocytophaga sp.]
MKKTLFFLLLFTSYLLPAQEAKILSLSETIWKAMQEVNTPILTENIAPEAVFVHMGATLTRDKEMEVLAQRDIVLKEVETQETSVRIVGKTAVLLRKLRLTAIVGGNKVLQWGLCEVSPETIRKAHKILPLTVIQSEYSLFV